MIGSEHTHTEGFWLGRMSATLGESARMIDNHDPKGARKFLQSTLAEFIASPAAHEETRQLLRPYLERRSR